MSEHQPSPSEPDVDLKLLESRVDTMEEKLRGRLDSEHKCFDKINDIREHIKLYREYDGIDQKYQTMGEINTQLEELQRIVKDALGDD